jgi:hypothetical protein
MKFLAAALFVAGCAQALPVRVTLPVHSLKAPEPLEQQGVTIAVEPITHQSFRRYVRITGDIKWLEIDRTAPVEVGSKFDQYPRKVMFDTVPLVPLPAMRVAIRNQTDKPLALAHSQITLGPWPFMRSSGEIQGRVEADLLAAHPDIADNRGVLDKISGIIGALPIITSSTVIAPGQTFQGFICFQSNTHDVDEFNDLMEKTEELTLSIANVEGAPTFTFTLPRDTQQKQMTCPGDLKKPTQKKCKEG